MSKITKSNPVLKRNGVENSCNPSLSIHYFLSLTAMRNHGVFLFILVMNEFKWNFQCELVMFPQFHDGFIIFFGIPFYQAIVPC